MNTFNHELLDGSLCRPYNGKSLFDAFMENPIIFLPEIVEMYGKEVAKERLETLFTRFPNFEHGRLSKRQIKDAILGGINVVRRDMPDYNGGKLDELAYKLLTDVFTEILLRMFDLNNDGVIDVTEILRFSHTMEHGDKNQKVELITRALDIDEDGYVSFEEAEHYVYFFAYVRCPKGGDRELLDEKTRETFEKLDTNNDGKLSTDEILAFFEAM